VCMEEFETSRAAARTIVYPFACGGGDGIRHAICRTCDRSMFNRHGDACPICRAPRLGSSIASLGQRPPRERELAAVPLQTSSGTIFFPVGDDDDGSISVIEVRRINHATDASSAASASTIMSDILSDPVVQAAIDGLRNPGRIDVGSFLANIHSARRARNSTNEIAPVSVHESSQE